MHEDPRPSGPVFLRRCQHPFDGQVEASSGGGAAEAITLNLHVVMPDGSRMWIPARWTSLEARDPKLGELPFVRLRKLLDDRDVWRRGWTRRERSLLALLEWEERVEAWLRIPAPDREALVRKLAELMVRQADRAGRSDERVVADHEPSP